MLTFITLVSVSLMILTFLLLKRKDRIMFKKHGKDQKDKHDSGHSKHKIDIAAGELIVTGEDEIHIELPKRPKEVLAMFSRSICLTPCNPRHFDELKCYVCHFHKKYCLVIKWNVSNTRKIVWEAIF